MIPRSESIVPWSPKIPSSETNTIIAGKTARIE